ncbi:MAG: hypothetical protein ACKVVP_00915 [Chloroflexota bacterium]
MIHHPRLMRKRAMRTFLIVPTLAIAVAIAGYAVVTTPKQTPAKSPLYAFDPETVGRYEQAAWAQYYWRQWPQMFDSLLRMTRSAFGISFPHAVYATYENTLAQIAWARQGDTGGEARARMRTFYEFIREPVGGAYDTARAADLEVNWWAVHRNRDQHPDRTALTEALSMLYAEVYQLPADRVTRAAALRAEAMDISDQWIREGKLPESPLLQQITNLLIHSYTELKQAVSTGSQ